MCSYFFIAGAHIRKAAMSVKEPENGMGGTS